MILLKILWEYLKIGVFAVGGGMVALPFLYDISEKTHWFTKGQLVDMLAISESTPGPIGINMATFSGYTAGGFLGALIGTLAVSMPGVILVVVLSSLNGALPENKLIQGAFYGIRPAATGLICGAGLLVAKLAFFHAGIVDLGNLDLKSIILGITIFIFSRYLPETKRLHPVVFIGFAAICGVFLGL